MSSMQQALIASASAGFSMTAGQIGTITGYSAGAIGSTTPPNSQVKGKNLDRFFDDSSGNTCLFSISPLVVDPGASFVTSVKANGVTKLMASASYSFVGGNTAQWEWAAQQFGFSNGATYPVTYT